MTVNRPPTVATPIGNMVALADSRITIQSISSTFIDADGDALSIQATILPQWMTHDTSRDVLTGIIPASVFGSVVIQLTASDTYTTTNYAFKVQANHAPYLNAPIPDQPVSIGNTFSFSLSPVSFVDITVVCQVGSISTLEV